jgi:hypothetical protein
MNMNTVKDMDKILGILDAEVAKRKIPFDAIPERTGAEYRALAEDHEEYVALLARERKVINAYFNAVQMQEWAQNHKRWIQTGLNGYTTHELSPVGKETLKKFISKIVEETWWDANEDRLMAEFESSRQYLGDDDRNFEWYIEREYETYLRNL